MVNVKTKKKLNPIISNNS